MRSYTCEEDLQLCFKHVTHFFGYCSYYSRAPEPRGYGVFYDLWRETVLASACEPEQKANYHQRAMKRPRQKTIKIACTLLGHNLA